MENSPNSVDIHILTDSRGAGLQRLLSQEECDLDLNFHVTVRSGANFKQLADLARNSKDKFAYQIVAGGICSLTIKSGKFISYERDTTKITSLKGNILDILSVLGPRVTVRNPLLLCPLVLAQDGGTRSWQKCLHHDFSATVLNFSTEMHQSVGNGMCEFCDMSKLTITIVDANDLTSRESRC